MSKLSAPRPIRVRVGDTSIELDQRGFGDAMGAVVRSIDVGFGQVKYVARVASGDIECAHFSSVALPSLMDTGTRSALGGRRRTTSVRVGELFYEVGHDIDLAGAQSRPALSIDHYVEAPEYTALMRAALHYMQLDSIDVLVVGLPVSVYRQRKSQLERLATGVHDVGKGRTVTVKRALVVAQPQGALVTYAVQHDSLDAIQRQESLIIDAGTRTLDWLTARGLRLVSNRSHSAPYGVYSITTAITEAISDELKESFEDRDAIDLALRNKLIKKAENDPNVERKKAAKALARFMRLHPHNIGQKTEVMVEHFQHFTRHKIGGHAKAMVVTGSRLEAVRYKQEFDRYIEKNGYPIKSLVAFSGVVEDDKIPEKSYTEVEMNDGLKEKELPDTFAKPDYRVLLVAEKYQTGFDLPSLHTMYVDKRLAGIQAVQTLSRLNRTHPLKDDTFVLDFVNDPAEIQEAFRQYYEGSVMGEEVDPDKLYEVKAELDASGIYLQTEVDEFSRVFFAPKRRQSPGDHKIMNALLDQAVARFKQLQDSEEEEAEQWRGKLQAFRNLYGFLSQVIPYQDSDLEKLFTYLRHLAMKLPKRNSGPGYQFDEEVELDYYRLQKISEGSISLNEGYAKPLDGPREVGSGIVREEHVSLSRLIDIINERFGGELNEADQLFFDQIAEAASQSEALQKAAEVNSLDKFQLVFRQVLESLFIERMDLNEELFTDYMGKPEMQELVSKWLGSQVYERLTPKLGRPRAV